MSIQIMSRLFLLREKKTSKSSLKYFNTVTINLYSARYFEDEEVLNRVPKLFLFLGVIFAVMQVIAFILLRAPSSKELKEIMVCYVGVS